MSPIRPLTPIFDSKRRTGGVAVGNSSPATPPYFIYPGVGQVSSAFFTNTVQILTEGDTAYVLSGGFGGTGRITAVNITDPLEPSVISSYTDVALTGLTSGAIGDGVMFVRCINGGADNNAIVSVDIGNPASMSVLGSIKPGVGGLGPYQLDSSSGRRVALNTARTHVFTTVAPGTNPGDGPYRVMSIDVTDPVNMTITSSVPVAKVYGMDFDVQGDYLYQICGSASVATSGTSYIRVSDPTAMAVVGSNLTLYTPVGSPGQSMEATSAAWYWVANGQFGVNTTGPLYRMPLESANPSHSVTVPVADSWLLAAAGPQNAVFLTHSNTFRWYDGSDLAFIDSRTTETGVGVGAMVFSEAKWALVTMESTTLVCYVSGWT